MILYNEFNEELHYLLFKQLKQEKLLSKTGFDCFI